MWAPAPAVLAAFGFGGSPSSRLISLAACAVFLANCAVSHGYETSYSLGDGTRTGLNAKVLSITLDNFKEVVLHEHKDTVVYFYKPAECIKYHSKVKEVLQLIVDRWDDPEHLHVCMMNIEMYPLPEPYSLQIDSTTVASFSAFQKQWAHVNLEFDGPTFDMESMMKFMAYSATLPENKLHIVDLYNQHEHGLPGVKESAAEWEEKKHLWDDETRRQRGHMGDEKEL